MLSKVMETVQAYMNTNKDVLDTREIAELQAQIDFLHYLEKDKLSDENRKLKSRIARLQQLLFKVMNGKQMTKRSNSEDIKVTRREFLDIYGEAEDYVMDDLTGEFREDTPIYGKNVTVHWAGIYCDCSDGAVAYNGIVSGIKGVIEEDGDE